MTLPGKYICPRTNDPTHSSTIEAEKAGDRGARKPAFLDPVVATTVVAGSAVVALVRCGGN
jgi:hypothetical protein